MKFIFLVKKTWSNDKLGIYHALGNLEEGKILSGSKAVILGEADIGFVIKSVIIAPTSLGGDKNELTLSLEKSLVEIKSLEGKRLCQADYF